MTLWLLFVVESVKTSLRELVIRSLFEEDPSCLGLGGGGGGIEDTADLSHEHIKPSKCFWL